MYPIEELSTPAQAEAMRYGHSALLNPEELPTYLGAMAQFLEEREQFSVKPLSSVAGQVTMYSVRIFPVVAIHSVIE